MSNALPTRLMPSNQNFAHRLGAPAPRPSGLQPIPVGSAKLDLQVATYITSLTMNYLFTGRFKRTK